MTPEQQTTTEPDDRFLPASSPWVASHFKNAVTLLGEFLEAADLSDFTPGCISDEALRCFIDRFCKAWAALPDEYSEDKAPPLELVVLCRALWLLEEFLLLEESRRKYDPEYAADCKGANETKRYRDTHNGEWPPEVLGGKANG